VKNCKEIVLADVETCQSKAAIGPRKLLPRETVKAMRKNVLAKVLWWYIHESESSSDNAEKGKKTYETSPET